MKCEKCLGDFEPTIEEMDRINRAIESGTSFLVLICPLCNNHTSWRSSKPTGSVVSDHRFLRCPVGQCVGWVEHQPGNGFFECNTCGSYWRKRDSLNKEVKDIINKYPYRAEVYSQIDDGYISDLNQIYKGYAAKVYREIDGIRSKARRD